MKIATTINLIYSCFVPEVNSKKIKIKSSLGGALLLVDSLALVVILGAALVLVLQGKLRSNTDR